MLQKIEPPEKPFVCETCVRLLRLAPHEAVEYPVVMQSTSDKRFDANFLTQMLLEIGHEQSLEELLRKLVERGMERPHLVCVQFWLIEEGDLCATCPRRPDCSDQSRCLHLAAAKSHSIVEPRKGFGRLDPQTAREPLGTPPIGNVVLSGQTRTVSDLNKQPASTLDPGWMREEGITGYVITPISYKGEAMGAIVTGTRESFKDELRPWGTILANQIGAAIANARAFEKIRVTGKRLEQANQRLERELAEHKETADKLRESEHRYRELVENANSIILRWDCDGRITFLNEFGLRFFGYSAGEVLGCQLMDTIVPQTELGGRDLSQLMNQICADPKAFEQNINENVRRNGERVWIAWTNKLVLNEQGRVKEILSIGSDVTERKRMEEKLHLMQFSLEHASDAVFWLDLQGRIVFVNEAACHSLNRSQAEMLSLSLPDINPTYSAELWTSAWERLKARRFATVETLHQTKDGRIFPVEVTSNFVEFGGKEYVFAFARDITERKRAEEAQRRTAGYLAETQRLTHTGTFVSDENTKPLYWSEELFRIFGLDPEQGLPTRDEPLRRVHPEDRERFLRTFQRGIREKVMVDAEYRIVLPDGTVKHVYGIGHPVLNADGGLVEFIGTVVDITERKLAEEELRKHREHLEDLVRERTEQLAAAKERAESADRVKSAFLATMSHELRTPLNAVLGFSRLLKRDPEVTPRQLESLDIIVRSGEHLLNLINNVLDIAKIESGSVALVESEVDLLQLLHEIQSLMGVSAAQKGLQFALEIPPDLPRFVAVDAGKLRQVLLNLVGNAIKYTDSGGTKLRAKLVSINASETAQVRFEVEDTGPGISQEHCERIFLPFVQLGGQSSTEAGTGLGLAICKQYVELMRGQIGISSQPGKGSLFYFNIPVRVLPSVAEPERADHGRVLGLAAGQAHYRLLIVEDQVENRLLLKKLLEPLGFELREAVNGQEAVALFEQWHPDLVWMDIRMPVMDGLEAVRRIRSTKAGTDTKIIALTAHALEDEKRPIMDVGCDDLVRKPFREQEIFDALTRHLHLEFIYEKAPLHENTPKATALPLRAEQLGELPAELLGQLRQAVLELDTARTQALIERVTDLNASLGGALNALATRLDYEALLKLTEAGHSQTEKPI